MVSTILTPIFMRLGKMSKLANKARIAFLAIILSLLITAAAQAQTWTGGQIPVGGPTWNWAGTTAWTQVGATTTWFYIDNWGRRIEGTGTTTTPPTTAPVFTAITDAVFGGGIAAANKLVNVNQSVNVNSMRISGSGWTFTNAGNLNGTTLNFDTGTGGMTLDGSLDFTTVNMRGGGNWTITNGGARGTTLNFETTGGSTLNLAGSTFQFTNMNVASTTGTGWTLGGTGQLNVSGTLNFAAGGGTLRNTGTGTFGFNGTTATFNGGTWNFSNTGGGAFQVRSSTYDLESAGGRINLTDAVLSTTADATVNLKGGNWVLNGADGTMTPRYLNLGTAGGSLTVMNGFTFEADTQWDQWNPQGNWTFSGTTGSIEGRNLNLGTAGGALIFNDDFTFDYDGTVTMAAGSEWRISGGTTNASPNVTLNHNGTFNLNNAHLRLGGNVDFTTQSMLISGADARIISDPTLASLLPLAVDFGMIEGSNLLTIRSDSLVLAAQLLFEEGIYINPVNANASITVAMPVSATYSGTTLAINKPVFGQYDYADNVADNKLNRNVAIVEKSIWLTTPEVSAELSNRFIVTENQRLGFANPNSVATAPNTAVLYIRGVNAVGAGASGSADLLGGAVFLKTGADLDRRLPGGGTVYGRVQFEDNEADHGAAVYAMQNLTITGNMAFENNEATVAGGAIFMSGNRDVNVLTIDSGLIAANTAGDIVFRGNIAAGAANAIHLEKNITVNIEGERYIYMEDGFSSGQGNNLGGNVMNVNIANSGFIQFGAASESTVSTLDQTGGAVNINSGIVRVVGQEDADPMNDPDLGGSFSTMGSGGKITVAKDGALAGGGYVAANAGFVFQGTVAPDFMEFAVPANLQNFDVLPTRFENIGRLHLSGNVLFDGATYNVDISNNVDSVVNAYQSSDRLLVTGLNAANEGDVTFGGKSTIDITQWNSSGAGKYIILASEGVINATNDTIMQHFTITKGGQKIGTETNSERQVASLFIEKDLGALGPYGIAAENDIVLHTSNEGNIYLVWNEQADVFENSNANMWNNQIGKADDKLRNWLRKGMAADMDDMLNNNDPATMKRQYFLNKDYVIFNSALWSSTEEQVIQIDNNLLTVSGMEILGGNYTFNGAGKTIEGVYEDVAGVVATGKLVVKGANTNVTLNTATDFVMGTELSGGAKLRIGQGDSLGAYDGTNRKGVVYVLPPDTSYGTYGGTIASDTPQSVTNRFIVGRGETGKRNALTFDLSSGVDFTIDGVDTTAAPPAMAELGGAVYLGLYADINRINDAGNTTLLTFSNNVADKGGAIYAERDLTVYGNTVFRDNTAVTLGGAIYMAGNATSGTPGRLTFNTAAGGDIVFAGNAAPDDASGQNVFLNQNTQVAFSGSRHVFFDGSFGAGALGGNTMTSTGFGGFAQFQAANRLSADAQAGGNVDWNSGTFRLAAGASFTTGGSVNTHFALGAAGTLAGQGVLTTNGTNANAGFIINGTLAPDSDTLYSKLDGTNAEDHFVVGELDQADRIGELTFNGKFTLQGATYNVDIGPAADQSDKVHVSGDIALAGKTTVNAAALTGTTPTGDYMIMNSLGGKFLGADDTMTAEQLLAAYFNELVLTARQDGELVLKDNAGVINELWIEGYGDNKALKIYWTGRNTSTTVPGSGDWDNDLTKNWTIAGGTDQLTFLDTKDYVIFDDQAVAVNHHTVNLDATMSAIGMEIVNGTYTFSGTGSIDGINGQLSESGSMTDYFGELLVKGGTSTLNLATNFKGGTIMSGGRVNIGDVAALGVYDHTDYMDNINDPTRAAGSKAGFVQVTGNATVGAADDFTIQNRFEIAATSTLTFDVAAGKTLTITNRAAGDNGGALFVNDPSVVATIANTGTGILAFTNNIAQAGGAIYSAGNLTLRGKMLFSGNNRSTVARGGAIDMFSNTAAEASQLTIDTGSGNIAFIGNATNASVDSVNLEYRSNLRVIGGGDVYFGGRVAGNDLTVAMGTTGRTIINNPVGDSRFWGGLNLDSGTLVVATGRTLMTGAASTIKGTLAGGGTIYTNSESVTVGGGTLSPDSYAYTFDTATHMVAAPTGSKIGTLTFDSGMSLTLNNATLLVDLDAGNLSDLVKVNGTGTITATGNNKITVDSFVAGTFDILTGANDLTSQLANFHVDPANFGSRNALTLQIKQNGIGGNPANPDDVTLQLVSTANSNTKLFWTANNAGASEQNWYALNTGVQNWISNESAPTTSQEYFLSGDYIVFNDASYVLGGQPQTVTLTGNAPGPVEVVVSGMEVLGGEYTFDGPEGSKITGDTTTGLYTAKTGKLKIDGRNTQVQLNIETDFEKGTEIGEYSIVFLGHAKALGEFADPTLDAGRVTITDFSTVVAAENLTIRNHFDVTSTGTLSLNTNIDKSLTIQNVVNDTDGGAISSEGWVYLPHISFLDNHSDGLGGAIYMKGGISATDMRGLSIFAVEDDVKFSGNTDSTGANSIHLNQFTYITIDGDKDVLFDDPISAGALGGNALMKDNVGTVAFTGASVLNRAGTAGTADADGYAVRINSGALQLVGTLGGGSNASLEMGNSKFLLKKGVLADRSDDAVLYGNGTLMAGTFADGGGFVLQGTIGAGNQLDGSDLGRIDFDGDVQLDGVNWIVSLDKTAGPSPVYSSDLLAVTGEVTFGAQSTIDPTNIMDVQQWLPGEYMIMTSDTTINSGALPIEDHFNVLSKGHALNARQYSGVELRDSNKQLWLIVDKDVSQRIEWNGEVDLVWGNDKSNWYKEGTNERLAFLDGDYVIFNTRGATRNQVSVVGAGVTVSGMEIASGEYAFSGGTIYGDVDSATTAAVNPTGMLQVVGSSTVATFHNETYFKEGTFLAGGAKIVLGNNAALGIYDPTTNGNNSGLVVIQDSATVTTLAGSDRTIQNRFMQYDTLGQLTLAASEGTTLTVQNVYASLDGGAVATIGNLNIVGNTVFRNNSSDANGGAVASYGAIAVTGKTTFTGNEAGDAGGAIAARSTLSIDANATFTDNRAGQDGGAIVALGTTTIGSGAKFENNKAGTNGGAIAAQGTNVTINGNTTFTGNEAISGLGGAVALDNASLVLNTAVGAITFENNTASGVSNAVHLNGGSGILIEGGHDVSFNDPFSGSGGGNYFIKNGAGSALFRGNSVLNAAGDAAGAVAINEGTMRLLDGAEFDGGQSPFGLARQGTLSGTGKITALGGFTLNGTLSADDDENGRDTGVLTLVGDTVFDGATLIVDLAAADTADRIDVEGSVTFANRNNLNIVEWINGTFDLITADSVITTFDETMWNYERGNARRTATLALDAGKQIVQLTTQITNDYLVWNNGTGSRVWDMNQENWKPNSIAGNDRFLIGDYAIFNGLGTGRVDVTANGVTTSGMMVAAGDYDFHGGPITGRLGGGTLNEDAALRIAGQSQTQFRQTVDFEGGIFITDEGTNVVLHPGASFKTDGDFLLGTGTHLTMALPEGVSDGTVVTMIQGNDVTLDGEVTVTNRPRPTSLLTVKQVVVSGNDLNTERLTNLFTQSSGMWGQFAVFASDARSMDLAYRAITPGEFAYMNGLGWNKKEVAENLTEIFQDPKFDRFDDLKELLYTLDTNDQVDAVLDELRGSEMAADALSIALWSPWRPYFNHLSQDQRNVPGMSAEMSAARAGEKGDVRAEMRGQVGTQKVSTRDVWIEAFTRTVVTSSDSAARNNTMDRTGVVLGIDKKINWYTTIGAALNYATPQINTRFGKVESTDWGMAVYGKRYFTDTLYMNAYFGFGHQEYKYDRHVLTDRVHAKYDGNALYGSAELVRPVQWTRSFRLLPLVALDFQKSWAGDVTETGSKFANKIKDGELESTAFRIGLNTKWQISELCNFDTRLQYAHQIGGNTYGQVNASFVDAPPVGPMQLRSVDIGRDTMNFGVGGQVYLTKKRNIFLFGDYDYDFGEKAVANTGQLGFVYHW